MLTDTTYDAVKRLTQVVLPASGSLYFGLSQIWGFPAGEQVVGSIALFTTFLGVVLGISKSKYDASGEAYDGEMVVSLNEDNRRVVSLVLDGDPNDIADAESVAFRVVDRSQE